MATFPKCRYNEYFKTTFPDDLERYDFVYIGIGIHLTSLKRTDFFFKTSWLQSWIVNFCKHLFNKNLWENFSFPNVQHYLIRIKIRDEKCLSRRFGISKLNQPTNQQLKTKQERKIKTWLELSKKMQKQSYHFFRAERWEFSFNYFS